MPIPDGALADAKAYLRLDSSVEDALLETLIGSGIGLAERFTGLALFVVERSDTLPSLRPCWHRLPATPVSAIASVAALDVGGTIRPLDLAAYAIDIDAAGDGWVRLAAPIPESRLLVGYTAGLAPDWLALPEPLRQGIVRLAAHLYAHRDAAEDAGPPSAVAALWRPFRRMRLS